MLRAVRIFRTLADNSSRSLRYTGCRIQEANSTGELTTLKGSPFGASVATRGIANDPSGKYLYLSNAEQILGYSIDASTGALTELSTSPYSAGTDPLSLCVTGTIE